MAATAERGTPRAGLEATAIGSGSGPKAMSEMRASPRHRRHVLFGRSFARWWDIVAGIRQDVRPGPAQTWAAMGIQGIAPYWFDVQATAYIGAFRPHALPVRERVSISFSRTGSCCSRCSKRRSTARPTPSMGLAPVGDRRCRVACSLRNPPRDRALRWAGVEPKVLWHCRLCRSGGRNLGWIASGHRDPNVVLRATRDMLSRVRFCWSRLSRLSLRSPLHNLVPHRTLVWSEYLWRARHYRANP